MLTDWDYKQVQWFDNLAELWEKHKDDDLTVEIFKIGDILRNKLGMPIVEMDASQSKFFKHHYIRMQKNLGTTVTEMDVIRRIEGW